MSARPLVLFCAALMLGSFFLPWIALPPGPSIVPWDGFKGLDSTQIQDLLSNLPPEGMAFFGSFALAAILLLFGLMGASPRVIVFLTGALPVGLVAWGIYTVMNQGNAMGIPVSSGDIMQAVKELSGLIDFGAWAWIGSGGLLFLIGLFGSGKASYSGRR